MAAAGVASWSCYTIARAIVLDRIHDPDDRAAAGGGVERLPRRPAHVRLAAGRRGRRGGRRGGVGHPAARASGPAARLRGASRQPSRRARALRVARAVALIAAGVLVIAKPLAVVQVAATLIGVLPRLRGRRVDPAADLPPARSRGRGAPARCRAGAPAAPRGAGARALLIAGHRRRLPGRRRHRRARRHAGELRGPRRAVRPPARRGRAPGDAQLDVGPAARAGSRPSRSARSAASSQDGIRGLLFDTHYADRLPNGRVRTFFASKEDLDLVKNQDGVSDASFDAALRLRERLGFRGEGERGMYLCHTFCELGATPLASGLDDIHDFLVTHPDRGRRHRQPGLRHARRLRAGRRRRRPGALRLHAARRRRLADAARDDRRRPPARAAGREPRRRRAVVPARPTTASSEETPFHFPRASLLTAAAALRRELRAQPRPEVRAAVPHQPLGEHRPGAAGPSDAAKVNAYAPLLARARECERIRHHLPNLLAINFYKEGDVFRVVDTLNGV